MSEEIEYTIGSENVFEDLGCKDPDIKLTKSQLVSFLNEYCKTNSLTQLELGKILNISQNTVSDMFKFKYIYSLQKLVKFICLIGFDVDIIVKPKKDDKGKVRFFNETI